MNQQEIEYLVLSRPPNRVVVDDQGTAVPHTRLLKVDVVFVRDDSWTLGAPSELEDVARSLWSDMWVGEGRCSEVDGVLRWEFKAYNRGAS